MILVKYYTGHRNSHGAKIWHTKLQCDECHNIWEEDNKYTLRKAKKRDIHLCPICLTILVKRESSQRGAIALKRISTEQRKLNASIAGKISQSTNKPSKTWFNTERWNELSLSEQRARVIKANIAAHDKLRAMSDKEREDHYNKVLKGRLGFISKGERELQTILADYGYVPSYRISNMTVDACNPEKKIIVEYNGDAYHCNPISWNKDQYSSLIKMTAGQKWAKDIARTKILNSRGYDVIVVWESDWKLDKHHIIDKIIERTNNAKV